MHTVFIDALKNIYFARSPDFRTDRDAEASCRGEIVYVFVRCPCVAVRVWSSIASVLSSAIQHPQFQLPGDSTSHCESGSLAQIEITLAVSLKPS